jgi:hypothetical protein
MMLLLFVNACDSEQPDYEQPDYFVYITDPSSNVEYGPYQILNDDSGYYIIPDDVERFGYYIKQYSVNDATTINSSGQLGFTWTNANDMHFQIEWEPLIYKVVYHLEGGTLRKDELNLFFMITYDTELKDEYLLTEFDVRFPGYYFDGWYSRRTGRGQKYADELKWNVEHNTLNDENMSDLFDQMETTENEPILNLYAYWTLGG